jgi:hypothetical protein
MPTDPFGGEQSGAGAGKRVENNAVALRSVLDHCRERNISTIGDLM